MKEEKGEEEDKDECLEIKQGENIRELNCLQVDLRLRKVLRGKKESTRSRRWSGSLLHILGSISIPSAWRESVVIIPLCSSSTRLDILVV